MVQRFNFAWKQSCCLYNLKCNLAASPLLSLFSLFLFISRCVLTLIFTQLLCLPLISQRDERQLVWCSRNTFWKFLSLSLTQEITCTHTQMHDDWSPIAAVQCQTSFLQLSNITINLTVRVLHWMALGMWYSRGISSPHNVCEVKEKIIRCTLLILQILQWGGGMNGKHTQSPFAWYWFQCVTGVWVDSW